MPTAGTTGLFGHSILPKELLLCTEPVAGTGDQTVGPGQDGDLCLLVEKQFWTKGKTSWREGQVTHRMDSSSRTEAVPAATILLMSGERVDGFMILTQSG